MDQTSCGAQASRGRYRRTGRGDEGRLSIALLLVAAVWLLLLAGALLEPRLGRAPALLLAFGAASALAVGLRPSARPLDLRALGLFVAGAAVGYASFPAWVAAIASLGSALGLPFREPLPPGHGARLLWLAVVALAPLFEEIAYRGRLLPALESKLGFVPALILTSSAFALPHAEPWSMLGTFLVGLYLGGLMHRCRSLALCIGIHLGLNASSFVCGLPPVRGALPAELAALVALVPFVVPLGSPLAWLPRCRSTRA